ncbi:MAG: hypothetical protein KIS61_09310 [Candidatus Eremiobacteraeota bacterium]|nr:hypothetical protein [Candidatus Eremiobacteraeota bacterium]
MTEQERDALLAEHAEKLAAWNDGLEQVEAKFGQLSHEYAAAAESGKRACQIAALLLGEGITVLPARNCKDDFYRHFSGSGRGRLRRVWQAAGSPKHNNYDPEQAGGGE